MNKIKVISLLILAMFVFSGCSVKKSGNHVMKINDTVVTQADFDKAFKEVTSNKMFEQMGIDMDKDPDNIFVLMLKEQVIASLIVKSLLNDEMDKRKIDATKEEVENAEKEVISKFGSKDQFMQILKLNGVSYDSFKKDLQDEIKMKKYVDSIAMVSIGDDIAKKYYNDNIDKFKYPKSVRASHILISANLKQIEEQIKNDEKEISDEDAKDKAEEILEEKFEKAKELQAKLKKNPKDFAKLAKENSDDAVSAIKGGDLGFFSKEQMVEPFSSTAFSLAPNTISNVIKTDYGFHIVMVTDRKEAGTLSFEQSKKDIINYLESQDKVDILKNKIASLRKEAKIEYIDSSFNPDEIQKKIKEQAEKNPELKALAELQPQSNK
ncbi:peptidylprolyl isomerase [bacterium]|nr:peptidylprolyl isomerase [bacterium]